MVIGNNSFVNVFFHKGCVLKNTGSLKYSLKFSSILHFLFFRMEIQ